MLPAQFYLVPLALLHCGISSFALTTSNSTFLSSSSLYIKSLYQMEFTISLFDISQFVNCETEKVNLISPFLVFLTLTSTSSVLSPWLSNSWRICLLLTKFFCYYSDRVFFALIWMPFSVHLGNYFGRFSVVSSVSAFSFIKLFVAHHLCVKCMFSASNPSFTAL